MAIQALHFDEFGERISADEETYDEQMKAARERFFYVPQITGEEA